MGADRLRASSGFLLMLAALVLCLPLPWVVAAAVAALVHECGHYLAICCFTRKNVGITFSAFSARMPLPEMGRGAELVCALAGPVFGMLLLLLARWWPRTAICALGQSAFNLLPVYPLDGGRALRCGLEMRLDPPRVEKVCAVVAWIFKVLLVGLSVYAAFFLDFGLLPLLVMLTLLFRIK